MSEQIIFMVGTEWKAQIEIGNLSLSISSKWLNTELKIAKYGIQIHLK